MNGELEAFVRTASRPELIAHRGYAARYPENTLPALEAAAAAGARFVEVDVQLAADGVPVLFHDHGLRRVCGVSGVVHRWRYADLERLSAHEPGRFGQQFHGTPLLPLSGLRAFLENHPDVCAFVEAKSIAIRPFGVTDVLDAIAAELQPVAGRCCLIARSAALLSVARERLERKSGPVGWHAIGGVIGRWRDRSALAQMRPEFLFCAVEGLPRDGELRLPGTRIAVYEVADPALAIRLHRRGVDMIETFAIAEMQRALSPGARRRDAPPRGLNQGRGNGTMDGETSEEAG
ncbi:Glycerophosphoryl diester phosphodiesterase [Thioalkalivibrio nitratireducens DSM 14787]|uniref:Glycerophosphoryl diester phosphodiesterase n=1 Tax=Thioalkalivibrio nitratireducens (strain DSM 14787 / UNIQEM 213 / ALEN2) TaxID=1255043 RepID=L0DVG2_THIND|nr:glycerophosphodiester phosphodiesterase family protein [Thioalkalivibrio nitratireducens]AGA32997.1 Glycerophosphoryl diester phosphodiesterase [Thioalkalivibrio nitratireducens DSM 14787]